MPQNPEQNPAPKSKADPNENKLNLEGNDEREQDQEPGTPEEAFKAATHSTDDAKPQHPGRAEHARDDIGGD